MDYFKKLLELLKLEREEDQRTYAQMTENSSAADRRSNGLTWYPVAIRGTEPSRGDYITVELERTTHYDIAHQFRSGASVTLFSNHNSQSDKTEGTVSYLGGNTMKITLFTDELPDWCHNGKLGVDLLFDNNSYDEMQNALKQAAALEADSNTGRLVHVLTGKIEPAFSPEVISINVAGLNTYQQSAVNHIVTAQDLAVIHGPPGTGKTTTLVQAIKVLISRGEKQLLVTAPSNTAVDLLSAKLSAEGLNVLRIGNPARVSAQQMALTLESRMAEHSQMKEVKKLKKQAAEYKNMAHKYKRNFGKAEREQRNALFAEARKIMQEVSQTEQYMIDDVVSKAQIVTSTLVGANHHTIRRKTFDVVVIDEAGQALEPACWIPILKAEKVIMAGDHLQLPPTIKSIAAARNGLSTTLLEKCVALHPKSVTLLEEQYRMNETIMGFSSREFYSDRLKAHGSAAQQLLFAGDLPLTFIDTAGCGFDEKPEGTSVSNPDEAAFLLKHLEQLITIIAGHYSIVGFPSIAVISPYKEQIRLLNEYISSSPLLQQYAGNIAVNTIDSFQGQERDVVYISMTRSNINNEIGFLADIRRMNVAMTRARKKLVVIGDSSTLSQLKFYADFIDYAEQVNGYQSAWEYLAV